MSTKGNQFINNHFIKRGSRIRCRKYNNDALLSNTNNSPINVDLLLKPSTPAVASKGKNLCIQMRGYDKMMEYCKDEDTNDDDCVLMASREFSNARIGSAKGTPECSRHKLRRRFVDRSPFSEIIDCDIYQYLGNDGKSSSNKNSIVFISKGTDTDSNKSERKLSNTNASSGEERSIEDAQLSVNDSAEIEGMKCDASIVRIEA